MKDLGDDLEICRPILRLLGAPERGNDERRRGPDSTSRVGHDPEGRPRCIHVALVHAERFHDLARDTETWEDSGRRHGVLLRQSLEESSSENDYTATDERLSAVR